MTGAQQSVLDDLALRYGSLEVEKRGDTLAVVANLADRAWLVEADGHCTSVLVGGVETIESLTALEIELIAKIYAIRDALQEGDDQRAWAHAYLKPEVAQAHKRANES